MKTPIVSEATAAQLGFPCLQHVTFAPTDEGLCVNAFYATQYMVERAYGILLGGSEDTREPGWINTCARPP